MMYDDHVGGFLCTNPFCDQDEIDTSISCHLGQGPTSGNLIDIFLDSQKSRDLRPRRLDYSPSCVLGRCCHRFWQSSLQ